ncbi:MAG: hypothetical protein AB7W28_01515 [Armatimonadota bacterium]
MDLGCLRREYGRYLCFHGGINIQGGLPHGTPRDVREQTCVREQLQAVGRESGHILCTAHTLQAGKPIDNILALFDAYRELA